MSENDFWCKGTPHAQRFDDVRAQMNIAARNEHALELRAAAEKEAAEKRKQEAAARQKIRCTQCGDMTYNPCRR